MLERILKDIDENQDEIIKGLKALIEMESSDKKATKAQEYVLKELKEMGFETECFREDERSRLQTDYSPYDFEYDQGAYNVAGTLKGNGSVPSLMLFAHIDTEAEDYFGRFDDPYKCEIRDGKIFGLGSSDDKGGIMMMLYAVKYLLKHMHKLPYDLCLLSVLGKHGGGFGTLSALMKGYTGENSIYLHPAETGHGFAEIKNISLGVADFDITVKGEPGVLHDDLSTGKNAAVLISYLVAYLEDYNRMMREKYKFDFGTFEGSPSFILNVGKIEADSGYGGINREAKCSVRIRFFKPLTIEEVASSLTGYLKKRCDEDQKVNFSDVTIERGAFRATPAMVETKDPFVQLIEKNITEVCGIDHFIHQYHGGSDIRLPMLYGHSKCVGIGPSCSLPHQNSRQMEWISIEDYINGIKILASILYDYSDFKSR